MSHKTRLRLAGIFVLLFGIICWGYPSYVVYRDYLELLNKADTVQLSVLTLWVPIGLLGALGCIFFYGPKSYVVRKKN